jgi:hypothetical protein
MPRIGLGRLLSLIYFLTWIYLVAKYIGALSIPALTEVFMNALIIALFVGLALNINAFQIRNHGGKYQSLKQRILYIRDYGGNVATFYIVPFCVSSASSLIVAADSGNLVQTLFRTESYALIMLGGFMVFILFPALYILYRHGWD